ncbi:MAG: hypothetical protein II363_00630 [Clostridia bacterium]|nr:hypothetical protein [Clostridia bacterium]
MFGYVRLYKPEIKMGEYEQYQGIYCTLCRRLGKRYGPLARLTLSYDMTFLALLHMALQPDGPDFCPGRCSFNPTKRCLRCQNTVATDLAADLQCLLAYHKLRDTLQDEGFSKRIAAGLCLPLAALHHRRAARRRPDAEQRIAAAMARQQALEAAGTDSLDRAAEPFAMLLQDLAADLSPDKKQRPILQRFGYCLGRWIYFIDAVDDLAQDLAKGRYNPYATAQGLASGDEAAIRKTKTYAGETLNACLAECIAAYNLLDIRRFDGILRNILELGMPAAQRRAITGEEHYEQKSV